MANGTCSVGDCDVVHYATGLCKSHYDKKRRNGDANFVQRFPPPAERFWRHVDKGGPLPTWAPFLGPCWLWTARASVGRYGQFAIDGRMVLAHRFSFEMTGSIPEGFEIDHLCRVPRCVNPDHLEPVSHEENVARARLAKAS